MTPQLLDISSRVIWRSVCTLVEENLMVVFVCFVLFCFSLWFLNSLVSLLTSQILIITITELILLGYYEILT